jgi:hypothetical protein
MKTLLYPQNFKVDELLSKYELSRTRRKNLKIRIIKIVSVLYPTNYNLHRFKADGFTHLSSKFKKRILNNDYEFVNKLLTEGKDPIVEITESENSKESYKVGDYSKSYRLKEKYRNSPMAKFNYKPPNQQKVKTNETLLDSQFNSNKLSIHPNSKVFLYNLYHSVLTNLKKNKEITLLKNYIGRNLNIIEEINEGKFYNNRSYSNNRYNSSITSLNKFVRPFLLVNNKPLVSVDIKSSQPYLLASLLNINFYNKDNKNKYNYYSIKPVGGSILFPRFLEGKEKGIEQYQNISFEDDFYSIVLRNELGREPTTIERNSLKHKTMQFLFYNNPKAKQKSELKYLVKQYPQINEFIGSCLNGVGVKRFSYLLQRAESFLVLDTVCVEFNNKYKSAPFFTIHDAVLTTEEYYDELYRIMFEQLKLMTGINPGLKIEKHSLDVTPSNDIIKYVTDKIIKRSKQIKVLNNTSGVFDFNIAKTEELIQKKYLLDISK